MIPLLATLAYLLTATNGGPYIATGPTNDLASLIVRVGLVGPGAGVATSPATGFLTVPAALRSVTLSWSNTDTCADIATVIIQRSAPTNGAFVTVAALPACLTNVTLQTSFIGLTNFYRVAEQNQFGTSTWSNVAMQLP